MAGFVQCTHAYRPCETANHMQHQGMGQCMKQNACGMQQTSWLILTTLCLPNLMYAALPAKCALLCCAYLAYMCT